MLTAFYKYRHAFLIAGIFMFITGVQMASAILILNAAALIWLATLAVVIAIWDDDPKSDSDFPPTE